MDINIEDAFPHRDPDNARLLLDLTNRRSERQLARVDVSTRLEPRAEIAMMNQQQPSPVAVEDETTCRDMTRDEMVG